MLSKEWAALKNGSDIRGVACEGIPGAVVNLTDPVVEAIATGFIRFLQNQYNMPATKLTIAIGHDSRLSAQRVKNACIRAITATGANIIDFGLCTTPAMFMSTIDESLNVFASVMLTASHLPFNRNGMKFFTREGGLEGNHITEILTYAQEGTLLTGSMPGMVKTFDYLSRYAEHIADIIQRETGLEKPFAGMKIAVDAGNGAGGFYAEKVLAPLGADISGSCFLEPDGHFPNHIPNPEDKDAMAAISKAVLDSRSDLGVIFDTDVDRAAIVDDKGREINKNKLIALISAVLLADRKGTIVTDSVTSTGLAEFITKDLGGVHHRFKRGYKNVINEAKRLNEAGTYCPLAIETSGHAALLENYFLDDGAYLVTKLLIKAVLMREEGRKLTELIENLKEPKLAAGQRLNLTGANFKEDGQQILNALEKAADASEKMTRELPNYEGVRVNMGDGWFLLRLSLHDPLMPLDIQCDTQASLDEIYAFLKEFLSAFDCIDLTALP
ncbi:MAG: phosphomannomutase/phosphoglucomutase [Ruminococcaceae bacterium]|nr:phosphomannomutase/phosphoglucomutase [Oscillospiraceae bacterium]